MQTFSMLLDTSLCDYPMLDTYIANNKISKNITLETNHRGKLYEHTFTCTDTEMHCVKDALTTTLLDFYLCCLRQFYIVNYAYTRTQAHSGPLFDFIAYKLSRLIYSIEAGEVKQLYDKLSSILHTSANFSIDGFFRFGMKNMQSSWRTSVDSLVDNVAEEIEFSSPITLRRTFLDLQKSNIDTLHIFANTNDLKFFDNQLNNYDPQLFDVTYKIKKVPFYGDDLTIPMLLTLAPRKLVIHCNRGSNSSLIKIIKLIFARRMYLY